MSEENYTWAKEPQQISEFSKLVIADIPHRLQSRRNFTVYQFFLLYKLKLLGNVLLVKLKAFYLTCPCWLVAVSLSLPLLFDTFFDNFNATGLHIENILDLKSYSLTEEEKNPLKCTRFPLKRNLGIWLVLHYIEHMKVLKYFIKWQR